MSQLPAIVEDEDSFLDRLNTFRVETWFAKPTSIAPEICARFGWSNIGIDLLECATCKASLRYEASKDILDNDTTESIQTFLQNLEWEHDADCVWCEQQCPVEFLTMKPTFNEIMVRYKRLGTVWDLPVLDNDDLIEFESAKLLKLTEKLSAEWDISASSDPDEWRQRRLVLTRIALAGWDMKVLDYPLIVENDTDGSQHIQQGSVLNRPEDAGYCLARQAVLYCNRCTASVGLWTYATVSPVPINSFKEAMMHRIRSSLQLVVDPETGEVQDLFRRLYSAGDLAERVETESGIVQSRIKTEIEKHELPSSRSCSLKDDSQRPPLFGLQRYKKQKIHTPVTTDNTSLTTDDREQPKHRLHVLNEHRCFCTYRNNGKAHLDNLINTTTPSD